MGRGREKLKAKFAGLFVTFQGILSLIYIAYVSITSGLLIPVLVGFLISFASIFAGIAVILGSRKGYFAATFLTSVDIILGFFGLSLTSVFVDLSILGSLWKGWKIQIDEDFDLAGSVGRRH